MSISGILSFHERKLFVYGTWVGAAWWHIFYIFQIKLEVLDHEKDIIPREFVIGTSLIVHQLNH